MASTRIRFFPSRSLSFALLALAAFGCQSGGSSGADDENDDGSEASSESTTVVQVSERADPSEASGTPANETPAEDTNDDETLEPAEPAAVDTEATAAPASTFFACFSDGGAYSDCETVFVTVVQTSPERCIQLTIDNCGTYGRQGLSADTPTSWRLASGSVGSDAEPCEPGVFYSGSTSLNNASGAITWDEAAPRPTDIDFDLTLELLTGDESSIAVATSEPLQPIECDE